MFLIISFIFCSYLLGSISSAVIVCNLLQLPDPRTHGSKNPGATNVLRIGSKKAAAYTLLGDVLKGLLPVLLIQFYTGEEQIIMGVAGAAFLGHLYPILYRFKGGKGVATALGVLLGVSWPVAVAVLFIWILVVAVTKLSSLAAVIAALLTPILMWFLQPSLGYFIGALFLSAILLWRHRINIQNLVNGTEGKINKK